MTAFELVIERCRILGMICRAGRIYLFRADRPSGHTFDATLGPPAIKHAETRHAVYGRLHAAGSRSFERRLRCIEPDIDTRSHQLADFHIVVFQVGDLDVGAQHLLGAVNPLDHFLAGIILGMGFAGINDLQTAVCRRDRFESLHVGEKQVGALIGRRAASKTDGQNIDIDARVGFLIDVLG